MKIAIILLIVLSASIVTEKPTRMEYVLHWIFASITLILFCLNY